MKKSLGKIIPGRFRSIWEDNINMDVREIGSGLENRN
jgi:hypothetical protein